jgi:FKBP-type peptidyl-prolyl cis-trans isomerase FkpA
MGTTKHIFYFLLAATLLAACNKVTYRKTTGGMPYQLHKGKGTQNIVSGNIVKASLRYKIKDSIYFSNFETVPVYIPVLPNSQPYDISELWTKLKVGDSVIATQMMDTFIKRNPTGYNPKFKKGDRFVTTIKVLAIFESDSASEADRLKTENEWAPKEIQLLEKYLSDNKISAQKTPSGAYVQIKNPGTGDQIDSGKYVTVNYTGTTFSGLKFDSNVDSAFGHVGPYGFVVNSGQMIKGFDEAVQFMKPGSSAKVYIPSMIAYGGRPNPQGGIQPYQNLIFDIEIVEVKDKRPEEQSAANLPVPLRKKVNADQQKK